MKVDPIIRADLAKATLSSEPIPTKQGELTGTMYMPDSFEEIRLFALLMWRFKRPNGPLTFLGNPEGDPDGPFKWDFLFEVEGLKIQVIRNVNGLEIFWWGRTVEKESIISFIDYNLVEHRKDIDESIESLESYTLLLNPYFRHRSMAELAKHELLKINPVTPQHSSNAITSQKQFKRRNRQIQKYFKLVDRQAMYSILLVTESAYLAEAYLNLMYAVLLREEIRASDRLLDESLHRKWKNKIEHLRTDCKHISKKPDLGDSRIRDAKTLFDLRNRIAHSYPDTSKMKIGEMWFYKRFPILPNSVPSYKFAVALNNTLPSKDDAIFSFKVALRLVDFLRELIDKDIVGHIDAIAAAHPLGFNTTKGIYGIPFGDFAIISLGFGKSK